MLRLVDGNDDFFFDVRPEVWRNPLTEIDEAAISLELKNIDSEDMNCNEAVPDETIFILTVGEAKFLQSWLNTFLKDENK